MPDAASHEWSESRPRERDFERFLTFVDAVVAIAITLLVLPLVDVAAAPGLDHDLGGVIVDHLAQIGAFVLSFVVIARFWFAQHVILSGVVATDRRLSQLLMAWLFTVVVLPFPTSLVAQAGEHALTKILYMGTMALSSGALAAISWTVDHHPELRDGGRLPDPAPSVAAALAILVALAVSLSVPATSYYPLLLLLAADRLAEAWRRRRPLTG